MSTAKLRDMGAAMNHSQHTNNRRSATLAATAALLLATVLIPTVGAQETAGPGIFDPPFMVEHRVKQTDDEGGTISSDPVTDYYLGNTIVSVRADGTRMVIDFERHEILDVTPEQSTYTALSFDRYVDLRQRLYMAERRQV
ncbi:MAG: hypothetical protein GY835_10300, partial [bacterium]|nr:hypothetical protein [bacterium]